MVPVSFSGEEMQLVGERAIYWQREKTLLVADLHLEKASWYASFGQMLPPYDSRETLERISNLTLQTKAKRVITLGDNFHDRAGSLRLDSHSTEILKGLTQSLDWVWISGNHDEQMPRTFGGEFLNELEINGIMLRHIAKRGERKSELSGHFHPKLRLKVRNRFISKPCAVIGRGSEYGERMILPAFGALTGGMDAKAPEIRSALSPSRAIYAVLSAKGKLVQFPLWHKAA